MKRKWLMIPLATGILAAGLTGASVLAQNDGGEQDSPKDKVAAKVAEKLGVDEQALKDALKEATQEVRTDRLQQRLDDMVSAGLLTQEQADAYLEWYNARPDVPNLGRGGPHRFEFGGRGFRGHRFGGHGFFDPRQLPPPSGGDVPEANGTSF